MTHGSWVSAAVLVWVASAGCYRMDDVRATSEGKPSFSDLDSGVDTALHDASPEAHVPQEAGQIGEDVTPSQREIAPPDVDAGAVAIDASIAPDPSDLDASDLGANDLDARDLDAGEAPLVYDSELEGAEGGVVHYALEWSWQGAVRDAATGHYAVDLADGAWLEVRSLAVSSTSFELIECASDSDAGSGAAAIRLWDMLRWLNPLSPSIAYAHHPAYTEGPSYLRMPLAQEVVDAPLLELGAAVLEAQRYCELHQVIEPIAVEGLLDNETLSIEATYFAGPATVGEAIDAAITLPMASLPTLQVEPQAQGHDVDVMVTRRVVDALRVAPWTSSKLDLAYALLRALAQATDVKVTAAAAP